MKKIIYVLLVLIFISAVYSRAAFTSVPEFSLADACQKQYGFSIAGSGKLEPAEKYRVIGVGAQNKKTGIHDSRRSWAEISLENLASAKRKARKVNATIGIIGGGLSMV